MAVSTKCEFLTGPADDETTECGADGTYFVDAAPEVPTLRGTTYCKTHANEVLSGPDGFLWMSEGDEWMPLSEALAAA